ncbi:MAG: AmmeMemoRadiSam system protein B, partial [Caldimicrobium sp.]
MTLDYKPLLRRIDVIPGEYQGKPVIFLRDPLGFIEETIAFPHNVLFFLSLMDGEHDLRDLQAEAMKRFGELIPIEEIINLVKFLDEKGYLWSENFEKIKEKAYEKWFQQRIRLMAHAGLSYPLEKESAQEFIDSILNLSSPDSSETPKILIVPHLDLRSGAKAYAEGYKRFKVPQGGRVIILGVGHHLEYPYSVLTKDLATPFGILRNDRGGLLYLTNAKKLELFPDHIAHKLEHSIEFQGIFLNRLNGEEIVILPFLIGSHRVLFSNKALVEALALALIELLDEKTFIVLGIDFCHKGLRYGDPFSVDGSLAQKILETDKTMIDLAFHGESEALERFILEREEMNVCGAGPLYILSLIIKKATLNGKGEIYYQEVVPFGEG